MQCGGITISFKLCLVPAALVRPQPSVRSRLRRPSGSKEHTFISPMWLLKTLQSFHLTPASETDVLSCAAIKPAHIGMGLHEDRYHMLIWQVKAW